MANQTYNLVCDALSRIVSRRAAENIVTDALRSAKISPKDVRPEQMQTILKSVVFARLQQIIPVAQAKGEIRQILNTLETQFSTKAFSPEVEEGWNALREELKRLPNLNSPRAQRLVKNVADLPRNVDPVRTLNDLWAELDLLQLEANGSTAPSAEPRFQGDLLLESGEYAALSTGDYRALSTGEYAALNFELELPETQPEPAPVLGRPGAGLVARVNQDLHLTVVEEPTKTKQPTAAVPSTIAVPAVGFEDVPAFAVNLEDVPALELNLDHLIEIPPSPSIAATAILEPPVIAPATPVIAATVPATVKPTVEPSNKPVVNIESSEAQEALLTRFALEEGVTVVLLSKRNREVLMARLPGGSDKHLAGVVAATAMLLGKRRQFRVFYTNLHSASAFIAPLGEAILTVLADAGVNVGRVFTELESL